MRKSSAVIAFAIVLPSGGEAATFGFRDFLIPGATSVTVAAINDFGMVTGVYASAALPYGVGFAGQRGLITEIASLNGVPGSGPIPSAPSGIDNGGTVIGKATPGLIQTFLWKNGQYTAFLGGAPYGYPSFPPFIGTGDHISYNDYETHGAFLSHAGIAGAETEVPINDFSTVASTNRRFEVAGEYLGFVGERYTTAVFFGGPKKVKPLLPPGAASSHGGWLNDVGQVAGSYEDEVGGLHGFIFYRGFYTSFDMPGRATALSVQGIDLSGRVVGAYQDRLGQHGFYYSHGVVTRLGTLRASDMVHMSVSHFGRAVAMSVTAADGTARSYSVRCEAGAGAC